MLALWSQRSFERESWMLSCCSIIIRIINCTAKFCISDICATPLKMMSAQVSLKVEFGVEDCYYCW